MARRQPWCRTPKPISGCSTSPRAPKRRKGFIRAWKTLDVASSVRRASFSRSLKPAMAYLVNITARAERDLESLYVEIHAEDSVAALKWYMGLHDAILTLERLPNRCPVTPENS